MLTVKICTSRSLDKKTKASFQRSEEVLPAHIQANEKGTATAAVSGGYKAPGVVAEGAGFGGIAGGGPAGGSGGQGGAGGGAHHHHGGGALQRQMSASALGSGIDRKEQMALEM